MTKPADRAEYAEEIRLTEIKGLDLVELLADGENPLVTCEEESRFSCAYKREYDKRLEQYNIEALMEHPKCESCDCPLVVVRDE